VLEQALESLDGEKIVLVRETASVKQSAFWAIIAIEAAKKCFAILTDGLALYK